VDHSSRMRDCGIGRTCAPDICLTTPPGVEPRGYSLSGFSSEAKKESALSAPNKTVFKRKVSKASWPVGVISPEEGGMNWLRGCWLASRLLAGPYLPPPRPGGRVTVYGSKPLASVPGGA